MTDISRLLKDTRLRHGLSLEEVAQRTYIKLPYLEALEEGTVERLPAPVYTYGYIRQYAKLLGLDGGALVAQFQQREHGVSPVPAMSSASSRGQLATAEVPVAPSPVYSSSSGASGRYSGGAAQPEVDAIEVRNAKMQAQQILSAAERDAQQLVRGAERYADEVLAELEGEIAKALTTIRNGRQFLASRRQPGPLGSGL